jgi:hypothetical protein
MEVIMNIFVTDKCPIKCARFLDSKRVVKMVLESTQMLCTALNELAGDKVTAYKSTHKNHPCSIWARQSYKNWLWLYGHALALSTEYYNRYGRDHACNRILIRLPATALSLFTKFLSTELTPFANCARNKEKGMDYTDIENTYLAYQLYMNDRWETDKRIPTFYGVQR